MLSLFLEYSWVLLVLIILEGILSADNALVLAMMVKHLPSEERRKALFYGLVGAFIFRFITLFLISFIVTIWQIQAIGAAYLLFIALHHLIRSHLIKKQSDKEPAKKAKPATKSGFWFTVFKVEVADVAFAIDSILAAVALAMALTPSGLGMIGGMDTGQFLVVFVGGLIGLLIMRVAATQFVTLLHKKPGLETAAFLIVGWVGVKLFVATLAHPSLAMIDAHFPHTLAWKLFFYGVLVSIALGGWFLSKEQLEQNIVTDKVS